MIWRWGKRRLIVVFMIAVLVFIFLLSPSASASSFTKWDPMSSGVTSDLQSVWGSVSTDVFAVGNSGTIIHYDGNVWGPMSSGITNDLQSVWGSASTDVFAVGSSGTIIHYDGNTWGPMTRNTISASWCLGLLLF
jgi:hypothetical protein